MCVCAFIKCTKFKETRVLWICVSSLCSAVMCRGWKIKIPARVSFWLNNSLNSFVWTCPSAGGCFYLPHSHWGISGTWRSMFLPQHGVLHPCPPPHTQTHTHTPSTCFHSNLLEYMKRETQSNEKIVKDVLCSQGSFPGNLQLVLVLRPNTLLQRALSDILFKFNKDEFKMKVPVRVVHLCSPFWNINEDK